jgi:hypothetical protein
MGLPCRIEPHQPRRLARTRRPGNLSSSFPGPGPSPLRAPEERLPSRVAAREAGSLGTRTGPVGRQCPEPAARPERRPDSEIVPAGDADSDRDRDGGDATRNPANDPVTAVTVLAWCDRERDVTYSSLPPPRPRLGPA